MERRLKTFLIVFLILLVAGVSISTFKAFRRYSTARTEEKKLSEAIKVYEEQEYTTAIKKFEECLKDPRNKKITRESLLYLARCYSELYMRDKAIEYWNRILEDSGAVEHHPEGLYRLGNLYQVRRKSSLPDFKKAEQYYNRIIQEFPSSKYYESAQIGMAEILEERNELLAAKEILEKLILQSENPEEIQKEIYRLNIEILFSPIITEKPKCDIYTVEEGDTLEKIAKKNNTTVELLKESNHIEDPRTLQIGQRLKVVTDEFYIVVRKSKNTLSLFAKDMLIKQYRVGTGKYDSTPEGEFFIVNKLIEPEWKGIPYGDPENILGTRWMGITDVQKTLKEYGIHGTWQDETVGAYVTKGCIRLLNTDVEELFRIVTVGTRVTIIE